MKLTSKIYVAGHQGLVGSALMRLLSARGYTNTITKSFLELDLRRQQDVEAFFEQEKPEYVFLAAARVGGIKANMCNPAPFMYDNLMIATNVIDAAHKNGVKKLLVLGSSCAYPRLCEQPIKEEYLLSGPLEITNEPYALAKIAALKLGMAYRTQYDFDVIGCMPTNLYGPSDTFDAEDSHVIPALITKLYQAYVQDLPNVTIWGTGKVRREFLFIDDCADALLFLMEHFSDDYFINVGTGIDISIYELAHLIKDIIGYKGSLIFDTTKPEGTPRKLLDVTKLRSLGWQRHTLLRDGIEQTVQWYTAQLSAVAQEQQAYL